MLPPPPPLPKSIGYRRITCLEKFHLLSIYLSQYEKKIVLLLVVKRAYIVCFTIFKRDIFCSSLLASDFCYRGKKLRVLEHYWHFQTPPVHPSHHSFNNEWKLGPGRNKDGGWNACLFKAWTLQWFHRLFSTSTPWLKRLTIFWRIFRRLAYFHVRKCATSQCSARSVSPDGILKVGSPVSRFRRNIIETIIPLINVRTEISKRLRGFL